MKQYKNWIRFALNGAFVACVAITALSLNAANSEEDNGRDLAEASPCNASSARSQGDCLVYLDSSGNDFTLGMWCGGDAYVYQRAKTTGTGFNTFFVEAGSKSPTYEELFEVDGDDLGPINVGNIAGYTHPGSKATLALWTCIHGVSADKNEASHTYHF